LELAEALGAEIVSMDSMSLYRGMDIGTAKPSFQDRARIRHHLVDELAPWESASVAWWLQRAKECCQEIELRGKRALFVGGTPLYLKALFHGLFEGPPANDEVRRRLESVTEEAGIESLHHKLKSVDPVTASRLHPNDVRRVIRALEVWELTGQPISKWQTQWPKENDAAATSESCQIVWLDIPRQELYARINTRVLEMFKAGLVDEVRTLRNLPHPLSREASQALGYKEVFAYLDGRVTLEQATVMVQTRTRNFAKRQVTWFRHLPGCVAATEESLWMSWRLRI